MAEKPKYPIPVDDDLRVQVLHDLNILDTVDEERFGELIRELSETLHAPIAYLSLIDAERQWLKAKVGPIDREVDREHAFCSHVILGSDPVVVADATQDPRFASSPLVTASPNLRFYACVPIADRATGQRIGTVCIADQKPRELTARELAILEGFASRVADEVNARPMVFVAYAAADLDWVQRLIAQGEGLARHRLFDLWSDLRVASGADPDWKLKQALQRSRAVVLLLSDAFLQSDFVQRDAFRLLLQVHEAEGAEIVSILLEPCDWAGVDWLAQRPPSSGNGTAVATADRQQVDGLFSTVVSRLQSTIQETGRAGVVAETPTDDAATPISPGQNEQIAPRLFLSHASEDADAVKELARQLRQAGVDVWLDIDEIKPGDNWMETLEAALHASDAFAVYIGTVGVERWINREVRVALARNVSDP